MEVGFEERRQRSGRRDPRTQGVPGAKWTRCQEEGVINGDNVVTGEVTAVGTLAVGLGREGGVS